MGTLLAALMCALAAIFVAESLYIAWAVRDHLRGRIAVEGWRRASGCVNMGDCVEVAWTRASTCDEGTNCVEFAPVGGEVLVRNSNDPDGPVLRFTPEEWAMFLAGAKAGEFD